MPLPGLQARGRCRTRRRAEVAIRAGTTMRVRRMVPVVAVAGPGWVSAAAGEVERDHCHQPGRVRGEPVAASASCRAGADKVATRETTSSSRLRGTGKGCAGSRSPYRATARAISSECSAIVRGRFWLRHLDIGSVHGPGGAVGRRSCDAGDPRVVLVREHPGGSPDLCGGAHRHSCTNQSSGWFSCADQSSGSLSCPISIS